MGSDSSSDFHAAAPSPVKWMWTGESMVEETIAEFGPVSRSDQ